MSEKIHRQALLTSRGCPLRCEFCSVTAFNGARYRRRPIERVLDELAQIRSPYVTFLDDNFGGLTKKSLDEAKRLVRGMVERGIRVKWGTQTGLNYADDEELLKLTKQSGCIALFVGIESVTEAGMAGSAKKGNIVRNIQRVREAVKRLHDNGIAVVGAFVFGNDEDDADIFDRTTDFIFETELDSCNLAISTPYPGTLLYDRIHADGRLLYHNFPRDWEKFNFVNVTYRPMKMSVDTLQEGFFKIIDDTTKLTTSFSRVWKTLRMSRDIHSAVCCFSWNRGFNGNNQVLKQQYVAPNANDEITTSHHSHGIA